MDDHNGNSNSNKPGSVSDVDGHYDKDGVSITKNGVTVGSGVTPSERSQPAPRRKAPVEESFLERSKSTSVP